MFVGDEDRVHVLGARAAQCFEATKHFLTAKASINKDGSAARFEQCGVARAARSENGNAERDASSPAGMMANGGGCVNRKCWEFVLIERVSVNADVFFAGGFLLVVLLHPRGEALSRSGVAPRKGECGDIAIGDGE